ncbi:NADPH dehydrogenase [Acrasis kona]|uniref:NADPH dehydrogenase n=1 Tax=Acrasis kona TaxID=1008807 RepID=A0AAW2ZN79_9EUKA
MKRAPLLFTPITMKGVTLKNRIVVSPMCQYSCNAMDGMPNEWHYVHYGSRAVGGAGLIIVEASAVTSDGRISPQDSGYWSDAHGEAWQKVTKFMQNQGSRVGIQLAHAGRKASTQRPWEGHNGVPDDEGGWEPVAPSSVSFSDNYRKPKEISEQDIKKYIQAFKESTKRSDNYGFDLVELHAAHGYLIHQFLSPLSNKRTDKYGGSFENRTRLLLEIVDEMLSVWPSDKPFWVRISATDYVEGGWDLDQSVQLSKILKQRGVDVIDTSSGGLDLKQKITPGPGYQVPFSEHIRKESEIATCAVGLITNAKQAEEILQKGQADFVALARQILRDPYFALNAAKELDYKIEGPIQYHRA